MTNVQYSMPKVQFDTTNDSGVQLTEVNCKSSDQMPNVQCSMHIFQHTLTLVSAKGRLRAVN